MGSKGDGSANYAPSIGNTNSFPRPIQPTVRSHRLTRTPLILAPNGHDSNPAVPTSRVSITPKPLENPSRRKRPVNLSADWTSAVGGGDSTSSNWGFDRVAVDPGMQRSNSEGEDLQRKKELPAFVLAEDEVDADDFAAE